MARLPIVSPSPGKVHDLLAAVKKKLGLVPNMTRVMANSPAVLEAYLRFSGALENGSLDAKSRERIALETAEANQCEYYPSAHSAIGKLVGLSEAEILDSRRAHAADPKPDAQKGGPHRRRDCRSRGPQGAEHLHQLLQHRFPGGP